MSEHKTFEFTNGYGRQMIARYNPTKDVFEVWNSANPSDVFTYLPDEVEDYLFRRIWVKCD